MPEPLALIADLGGTNARFALADAGGTRDTKILHGADYPTLADAAIGARVVEHITGFTARFVAHFRRCDPRRVEAAPA